MANEQLEKKAAKRRTYTDEDRKVLTAGLEKLDELGLDPKALSVLKTLVPVWHDEDKEVVKEAKTAIQTEFGGSEEFKNFINDEFKEALAPFAGIVKIIPIANNIVTFYARRQGTSKKMQTVSIDGTKYRVNSAYFASLDESLSKEERRELVLSHADTKKLETETELVEL